MSEIITSARVQYRQADGGLHTFHMGDRVTFRDRFGSVRTGPIRSFERGEGARGKALTMVTVAPEGSDSPVASHLVELRRVWPAGHPQAVAMAAPVEPLRQGNLVTVHVTNGKAYGGITPQDNIAVVLADAVPGQRVRVIRLGGNPDGGYALYPRERLTLVPAPHAFAAREALSMALAS